MVKKPRKKREKEKWVKMTNRKIWIERVEWR